MRIETGHIGLEVEEGGIVEDVEVDDVEDSPLAPRQPNHGDPYGVRPAGRAGCEEAMLPRVAIRHHPRLELSGSIHPVNKPDPLEAFEVIQRRREGLSQRG